MTDLRKYAPPIEDSVNYYVLLFTQEGIACDEEFIREQLVNQEPKYRVGEAWTTSWWHYDIIPVRPVV